MDPIAVPGPPPEAFNKYRPMSDLIKAQVRHFKHLEEKLPPDVRARLPQHRIITEDDAARYIAPMTKLLCSLGGKGAADSAQSGTAADTARPGRVKSTAGKKPAKKKAKQSVRKHDQNSTQKTRKTSTPRGAK